MNALFLTFWGKNYTNNFLEIFLPCLNENLKIIKKNKKNYSLEIWTTIKDQNYIKKHKLFKSVKKKIQCNFRNIDFILKQGKQDKLSKYEIHETISYIFKTSQCFRYEYLWFFYPEQFFSQNFILNISFKTKQKKADLILLPSLNCSQKNICELIKKKNYFYRNIKSIYLKYLDKSEEYLNINNVDNYQYLKVTDYFKNNLIIKSFHVHPLILKTKNNYEGFVFPFYPSHDEGISNFFLKKKILFLNNLKYGVLGGTTNIKTIPKKYKNSLKPSVISGILQFNECHLKFSKETFVHGSLKSKELNLRIKNVNNKINILRNEYTNLLKNLHNYPNIKNNKLFKLIEYENIIDLVIQMETKIKKFYKNKLIYYNRLIFNNFLKYSRSRIYNKKIGFKEFLNLFLHVNDKKDTIYLNYLNKIYFK